MGALWLLGLYRIEEYYHSAILPVVARPSTSMCIYRPIVTQVAFEILAGEQECVLIGMK